MCVYYVLVYKYICLHTSVYDTQPYTYTTNGHNYDRYIPLDLLLDGDTCTTEMVMQYMLGGNKLYHRLDPL